MKTYQVIDTTTGLPVSSQYKSLARALRRADKLDGEHGSCRYSICQTVTSE